MFINLKNKSVGNSNTTVIIADLEGVPCKNLHLNQTSQTFV